MKEDAIRIYHLTQRWWKLQEEAIFEELRPYGDIGWSAVVKGDLPDSWINITDPDGVRYYVNGRYAVRLDEAQAAYSAYVLLKARDTYLVNGHEYNCASRKWENHPCTCQYNHVMDRAMTVREQGWNYMDGTDPLLIQKGGQHWRRRGAFVLPYDTTDMAIKVLEVARKVEETGDYAPLESYQLTGWEIHKPTTEFPWYKLWFMDNFWIADDDGVIKMDKNPALDVFWDFYTHEASATCVQHKNAGYKWDMQKQVLTDLNYQKWTLQAGSVLPEKD